jgi:DNA-binding transcriptional ArsR family regulator
MPSMQPIGVLADPAVAASALDPMRARLLAALAEEPASAAALAARLDLPRQRLGHHLRTLEERGLLVTVGSARHGGLTERVLAPTAQSYVVSPAALGPAAVDPGHLTDRLSAAYQVAVAARVVRDVGAMVGAAEQQRKRLPTLCLDADVRFASAADRDAFATELTACVHDLVRRYHDDSVPGGRWYRVAALSHPRPAERSPHA